MTYLTDNYSSELMRKTYSGFRNYFRFPPFILPWLPGKACNLLVPACFVVLINSASLHKR